MKVVKYTFEFLAGSLLKLSGTRSVTRPTTPILLVFTSVLGRFYAESQLLLLFSTVPLDTLRPTRGRVGSDGYSFLDMYTTDSVDKL